MPVADLICDTKNYEINGLSDAVRLIDEGREREADFLVFGDYDADGICGAAILDLFLREVGVTPIVKLPRRMSEGYGIKEGAVSGLFPGDILITVDNGIAAIEPIRAAKALGASVLILDHHLAPEDGQLPEADVIIDPAAIPHSADWNGYCGAGLAYKLAVHYLGEDHPLIPKLKSLACIATVADAVPLIWDNRKIAKEGLKTLLIKEGTTMGLYALLCALDCTEYVDAETIAFKIGPALNASGRLYDDGAMDAFDLLTFEGSYREAKVLADRQLVHNAMRRELSEEWVDKAREEVALALAFGACSALPGTLQGGANTGADPMMEKETEESKAGLALYMQNIPEGILGILAGKLAEELERPCVVLTDGEADILKGSARTYGSVNLKEALDQLSGCFLHYGGHAAAAGLSMKRDLFPVFQEEFAKKTTAVRRADDSSQANQVDFIIPAGKLLAFYDEVVKMEPFGQGNPRPEFYVKDFALFPKNNVRFKLLSGGKGVKLFGNGIDATGFEAGDEYRALGSPKRVDLIGTLSTNSFMGKQKPQFCFTAVWRSEEAKREE